MTDIIISLKDVSFSYPGGEGAKFDNLTASIFHGEVISILGESGTGKTTLLKLLAGIEAPSHGVVVHHGVTPGGFVFQTPVLLDWLSVQDNISFPKQFLGSEDLLRRARLLEEVGLHKVGGRYPRELSGGMKSRVQLARALFREPRALFLDEPFSSLDEKLRFQMNHLFKRLRAQHGFSALLVSHSIQEAVLLSNRIWFVRLRGESGKAIVDEFKEGLRFSHEDMGIVDDPEFVKVVSRVRSYFFDGR